MSKKADQRITDLGYDIIKDSKRRTLYYDEKTKKGYQIDQSDIRYIRIYKLRFFFALLAYFVVFMLFREIPIEWRVFYSLLVGLILFVVITILFERLFLSKKIPFKINQQDFDQRFETEVLIQKRMLDRFHLGFVVVYGLLALLELYVVKTQWWIIVLIGVLIVLLIAYFVQRLLTIREQLKISKQK